MLNVVGFVVWCSGACGVVQVGCLLCGSLWVVGYFYCIAGGSVQVGRFVVILHGLGRMWVC